MGEIQKWTDSFVTLLFIWDILVSDTPQWNIYELDPKINSVFALRLVTVPPPPLVLSGHAASLTPY